MFLVLSETEAQDSLVYFVQDPGIGRGRVGMPAHGMMYVGTEIQRAMGGLGNKPDVR